jgi:hypothetical protein
MHLTLRRISVVPAVVAIALGASACGSSSSSSTTASTSTTTQAATSPVAVVGQNTSVALNPVTAQALRAAGVAIAPVAPATAKTGVLVFPESGGQIVVATLSGTIDHTGGVTLSHEGRSIVLSGFVLNTATKQITTTLAGQSVPVFDLNLASVRRASGVHGTVLASNITLTLTAQAASALNSSLGITLLKEGLPFGVATLTVAVKS